VLTSETEGLSNVLIEYAVAGLPAVAFDVGGNPEVIEDGETGYLVKPYDVNELAEKVDLLLSDPDLRRRLGRHASQRAQERFSAESMVRATETFYQEILS
jgi:glycosyltransferase involved in cell wall biosynthesis